MSENLRLVPTRAFDDQRPGTSGLRKRVRIFQQGHYLENFLQSVFDGIAPEQRKLLVLGGDGRYFNAAAAQTAIRMAAANGFRRLLVGHGAILSTPAASNLIRKHGADGGLILSASHNPAGPDHDFGIKFNGSNGGPAAATVTDAIFARSREITEYRILDTPEVDLDRLGTTVVGPTSVEVIDPVEDYRALMETLFDFDLLREGFRSGQLSICFDAMHAVTGPYARSVLEDTLGAAPGSVINGFPKEDFGGGHPDPNLVWAKQLVTRMNAAGAPALGAASDGDGDRNLILGPNCFVSPSDSLAVLAEHARVIPQFRQGLAGVARSMPTSTAPDRVASELGIECYETPTGWKFFGNLLDTGRINLCGEESFGTSGDHVREKDGLWAVLGWLSLAASLEKPVSEIVEAHFDRFGRSFYTRHDYEGISTDDANALMATLEERLGQLPGTSFGEFTAVRADNFSYADPVDGSITERQGIRILFEDGSRVVMRLSGTGTTGATLRVYLERYAPESWRSLGDTQAAVEPLARIGREVARIEHFTGMTEPSVIT